MTDYKPILRPVTDEEAARLSPWPDRIAGRVAWVKKTRTAEEINAEYDRGWYAELQGKWSAFWETLAPHDRHPGIVLRFFDQVRREAYAVMVNNKAVYGSVDIAEFLVSVNERLYAADVALMEHWYHGLILERIEHIREASPFASVLEIGCGSGVQLFHLYLRLALDSVAGNDLSPAAVRYLRKMAADTGIRGRFAVGNFCDIASFRSIVPDQGPWALLSVYAVQLVEPFPVSWFEQVCDLPNPPTVGIHIEPLVWPETNPFRAQCRRYAELNRYNINFREALEKAEAAGIIRIIQYERNLMGSSAFCPASIIAWVPGSRKSSGP